MSPDNKCPDDGCIALRHVLEAVVENKGATKQLIEGQHKLDKTLGILNENVMDLKLLGQRVGKVERNQWKMIGAYTVIMPFLTGLVLHLIK